MIVIRLARLLGDRQWTQAQLARHTGIRPNTINELYHGYAERVSLDQLNRICTVLNCTLDELIHYTPDTK